MPVVPNSAYVSVETVTILIRALANDMLFSQAGEILTDTAAFLLPLLNDALEWFENEVNNHGVTSFVKETVLTPILPIAVNDPGVQVNVSDTGYFDGVGMHISPQVPPDLYVPLFIWERQTGSTEEWVEMEERPDGLPSIDQGERLKIWGWNQDSIYMPGATQSNDLRLRYTGTHAPFVSVNDTLYFRGATGAIAYKMLSGYMASKNPEASQQAALEAKMRMSQIASRNSRMKQRESITRRSYGSSRVGSSFYPPRNT